MLKIAALVIVAAVAAVLGLAATRPGTFRVERSTQIKAAPDKMFALVNDFHQWGQWSPSEKLDPAMKRTHGGAPSGKDAVHTREGDSQVGAGRMEITEAQAPGKVVIKLDFIKPFEGHNIADVHLGVPGQRHTTHLGHERPDTIRVQGDAGVRQHGPDDRKGLRCRPGQPEGTGREIARSVAGQARNAGVAGKLA